MGERTFCAGKSQEGCTRIRTTIRRSSTRLAPALAKWRAAAAAAAQMSGGGVRSKQHGEGKGRTLPHTRPKSRSYSATCGPPKR